MKRHLAIPAALAAVVLANEGGVQSALSQAGDGEGMTVGATTDQKLVLSPGQRSALYQAVRKDKTKVAPIQFPAAVGADVPPMIELYALPDEAVADNPAVKLYKYTMVRDAVVLVDPTKMRVIDVIGPTPSQ